MTDNVRRDYHQMVEEEFARLAPYYDLFALMVRGMRRRVAGMISLPPNARVLDFCTGTGEQALAFAQAGAQVDGIDLSPDMLSVARRKDTKRQVAWHQGDATNTPFAARTFDVCTVSLALHDMPRTVRLAVLREMRRVVRPDGRIIVVDYGFPAGGLLRRFYIWMFGLFELDFFHEYLQEDLADLVRAAGLRVVRSATSHFHAFKILVCDPAGEPA